MRESVQRLRFSRRRRVDGRAELGGAWHCLTGRREDNRDGSSAWRDSARSCRVETGRSDGRLLQPINALPPSLSPSRSLFLHQSHDGAAKVPPTLWTSCCCGTSTQLRYVCQIKSVGCFLAELLFIKLTRHRNHVILISENRSH